MKRFLISCILVFPILLLWHISSSQSSHKRSLKMMTYNIKHGEAPGLSHANHHINLDTLAEVIKAENPDIIYKDTRQLEARTLNNLAAYSSIPVILTGDLNSSSESSLIATLKEQYIQSCQSCRPSFPCDMPRVKLDYIMYSKSSPFKVIKSWVIHNAQTAFASDHCPYAVKIVWEKAP